jgi:hypothetical protein
MNQNTSNLSHGRQSVDFIGQSSQHLGEVTQEDRTIDHALRLNRFGAGESLGNAAGCLPSALIPSESARIARHGDSQAPAFQAGTLMEQGLQPSLLETLHNPTPEPASIATLERAIKAGGEGVEASARSQSSQYIPPSRKFPHCPRP